MVFKMLGIELNDRVAQRERATPKLRQLFLTQSHVLASRVSEYYQQLIQAVDSTNSISPKSTDADEGLLVLEENNDERADLPAKFSDLEDKHFPLFVTFDQIRRMLEADLDISFSKQEVLRRRKGGVSSSTSHNTELRGPMESMFLINREIDMLDSSRSSFVNYE